MGYRFRYTIILDYKCLITTQCYPGWRQTFFIPSEAIHGIIVYRLNKFTTEFSKPLRVLIIPYCSRRNKLKKKKSNTRVRYTNVD